MRQKKGAIIMNSLSWPASHNPPLVFKHGTPCSVDFSLPSTEHQLQWTVLNCYTFFQQIKVKNCKPLFRNWNFGSEENQLRLRAVQLLISFPFLFVSWYKDLLTICFLPLKYIYIKLKRFHNPYKCIAPLGKLGSLVLEDCRSVVMCLMYMWVVTI